MKLLIVHLGVFTSLKAGNKCLNLCTVVFFSLSNWGPAIKSLRSLIEGYLFTRHMKEMFTCPNHLLEEQDYCALNTTTQPNGSFLDGNSICPHYHGGVVTIIYTTCNTDKTRGLPIWSNFGLYLVLKQSITINYSVHHFNVVHNFEFVNLFCECSLICNYLFIDSQENIKYFTCLHGGSLFLPTVKYP